MNNFNFKMGEEIKSKEENFNNPDFKKVINFFKQKKVQNVLIIILLLGILIFSSYIRVQNLPLLKDSTTGEYIPLALDPFYFLRIAETLEINDGTLPEFDVMRQPFNISWSPEILPKTIVLMYKIGNIFGNYSLQYIDVIYPVIFFILGLIVFFFLIYTLTKSKIIALLSSAFLAFIPSYLYRTMAGFADHEPIGMFAFFLTLLVFSLGLKYLEKDSSNNKKGLIKVIGLGLLVGFATALTIASWGGVAKFLFMIIPLSFFIFWLLKTQKENKNLKNIGIFYLSWFIFTILSGMFIFGYEFSKLKSIIFSSSGLISVFVLGFIIVDYFLILNFKKLKKYKLNEKYRIIYSVIGTIILGIIFLFIIGQNPFNLISEIIEKLLHPFGEGRVSLTVAENAQPYLTNWMNQMGKTFFWMFILGLVFIGIEISKKIQRRKEKNLFVLFWILMFSGIIFSRISAGSMLNGINFLSKLLYIGAILVFAYYFTKLYFNNKLKINTELLVIFSWMFFMLISARGAVRLFFVITPFVCFSSAFFVIKSFEFMKKNKDELMKMFLIILLIFGIIGAGYNLVNFYKNSETSAQYTSPSANEQWQGAMSWVKENTPEQSIFVHWWDYGYWVESLGERPTIADGGHFQGEFRNHMIGRYILTTPEPETALSFMKSNNVSYLLIDQTDLGKYSAYSKIGSDENWDRFAYISPFISDKKNIQETSNETIRIFQGGIGVDEDVVYNNNGSEIFIPGPTYNEIGDPNYKAFVGGVIFKTLESNTSAYLKQPEAVYIYNGQQIKIPLRYVYFEGKISDFKTGLDAVFFVLPRIQNTGQIDNLGAGLYLSPKVSKSLFAQLYLMDDPFNNYTPIKLAHSEDDQVVKSLKMQGLDLGDFVYYQGFRGPIKIWDVREIPENILVKEEFLRTSGEWAEFDDLEFVE